MDATVQPVVRSTGKRRYRRSDEKRRIVEETLAPEASVAAIARRHGVNANQVFHWRKLYQAGLLGTSRDEAEIGVRLLPVTVSDEAADTAALSESRQGIINIEFPGRALVSFEGQVDPAIIRAVLESLRG
jgi:transposase